MANINLFVNTNPLDRSNCLTNEHGSPLPALEWVFSDIIPITLTLLDTGSFTNTSGTLASIAIGIPGHGSLTYDPCGIVDSNTYSASIHLNTYELSASLGFSKSKDYKFEIQIVSGSLVNSFQHSCTVINDVVANQLIHISGSDFIISASFATNALSASIANRAISASHADVADKVSYGDPNDLINPSILVRGQGGTLISMGEQNLLNQVNASGMSLYNETLSAPDDEIVRIHTVHSWFSGSGNVGIGVISPDGPNKLWVAGNILCNNITASNLLGTASWATNAINAITASYAVSSSAVINVVQSSSNSDTSISASYARTASWARNVITLDDNLTIDNNGLNVGSGDELVTIDTNKVNVAGVIELNNAGLIAGFSSPDITTISNGKITALRITSSLYGTASWALNAVNAISANSAENAEFAISATNADLASLALTANTASFVTASNVVGVVTSASHANNSDNTISSSYALSASYVSGGGTTLSTGSTYPITASWSINASTASYISQSISFPTSVNGYFPYYTSNTLSTSSLLATNGVTMSAAGLINGTCSNANTASYYGGSVTSASFATSALTASYSVNLVLSQSNIAYSATTSIDFNGPAYQILQLTGSNVFITASNYGIGKSVTVEMSGSSSVSNIAFPSAWTFFPPPAATIPINGMGILALKSSGTTDAGIRGVFVTTNGTTSASYAITSQTSLLATSASYALNSSTASYYGGSVTSASYALTASFASTIPQQISITGLTASSAVVAQSYQFTQSYYNDRSTGSNAYTITNDDNGKLMIFTGSATQTLNLTTASIDAGWSCAIYQSGSGKITVTPANGATLKSRTALSSSAGIDAIINLIRVPNGAFVLSGDVSL